jgi:hypothetical protein
LPAPTRPSTVKNMARPRGQNEPSTYETRPEVPTMLQPRFNLLRAVIGEQISTSQAARELGIARVNMQSLVHRAEAAILSAMAPRPSGPAPKSEGEKKLEARIEKLERENARLKTQLQAADDMMGAAGEIIRALRGVPPMKKTSQTSSPQSPRSSTTTKEGDEDP